MDYEQSRLPYKMIEIVFFVTSISADFIGYNKNIWFYERQG